MSELHNNSKNQQTLPAPNIHPIHVAAIKAKLGRQVQATVRKTLRNIIATSRSCDVTSFFRHLTKL